MRDTMSLLTRDGYVVDEGDFEPWHADELTVQATKNPFFKEEPQPFPVFECRGDGTVVVPRFWGDENFGRPKTAFGHVEEATRLVFNGVLRSAVQEEAVEKATSQLRSRGGGILSARTGLGKTTISLCVACAMGLKTMVVVHKQFLMDQWEERIQTFVPLARVGRLQQDVEDVDDCDIVVGMLQSIAMRDYDEDIFHGFGMVIFDEVHVVPAPVFSRALLKLCTPYVLGLSATPERRDGLTRVIHWFVGPTFFEHALSGEDRVTVRVVNFRMNRALPTNTVAAATIVCNMPDRNALIVDRIAGLVAEGHKVLLLSDRRAHCENLKLSLKKIEVDAALYLGGMKNYELKKSEEARVLLGTYALAREGLDIPSLDALVLATPRSDVTQACGRILHGRTELSPVIVDVVDQWFIGKAQHKKRLVYYKNSGFNVA